jgi:phenylalanyl-tRNA synthetase beta chain
MKLSLKWLRDYIQIESSVDEIAKMLTSAGLEVEGINTISGGFEGVVVGQVMSVEKHPDADKLCVAQVFDGKETVQVVCGAANCRAGIKTAFARIGATLTDSDNHSFKIKKTKLRGIESSGMLCAADEINLSEEIQEGIIEFDQDFPVGADVAELFTDTVFEIGLTPNLGHCNSVIGVARELSAVLKTPVVYPQIFLEENKSLHTLGLIKVDLQDHEKCPRYSCRVIKNVKVGPSPEWLKQRLLASGIRPINNVVDITNYVFLESGQPLHAFDYDKIADQKIIVRSAQDGEVFVTLDDKERTLTKDDLLICDADKGIAIAGVMGGKNSEVTDSTSSIVLEAAYFNPTSIRKTSKRLGLSTDSSKRFERGSDPNGVLIGLDRAAMLIQQLAQGEVAENFIDVKKRTFDEKEIDCRLSRANEILGTNLSVSEVENVFKRLDFSYRYDGQNTLRVKVPTYRVDVLSEIDLIEEIARIYGYDNIERSLPKYTGTKIPPTPIFLFERKVRDRLVAEGLQEFLNCDLIGPSILEIIGEKEDSLEPVKVLNPISIEQSELRTSLLPGLLQVVKYNNAHQNQDLAGFEIGRIHYKDAEKYKEQTVMAILLSGKAIQHTWDSKPREFDFFDLKGIVENLLKELRIFNVTYKPTALKSFHTGRQAGVYVGSLEIGSIGEIHPAIQRRLDVSERIYFAEFNLHDLYQIAEVDYVMKSIPLYPASERDWTVTVSEDLPVQELFDLIKAVPSSLLKNVSLLDVYRSEKLGHDLKNITLHFVYRDDQKTLSQEAVDSEHAKITQETVNNLKK